MSEFVGLHLAQLGIPSDIEYITSDDYEFDPWRPTPNVDAVQITLAFDDAERLSDILELARDVTA